MSRLIRYDDAIERLGAHLMANAQIDWGGTASTDIEDWKELADMILNGVPTIDAVSIDDYRSMEKTCYKLQKALYEKADAESVVRCKECQYELICNHSVQHTTRDAHSVTIGSKTVEWCSYGERKESE